jgi:chemotaxis protein methyltransferase CheR
MNDHQFRQLLNHFGLSWEGYRKVRKGVKKRLCRHMHELGCRNVEQYLLAVDQDKVARRVCERLMTVSVSRFFRDRQLWQCLEKDVLPLIIRRRWGSIRVWSAGCARGEEVYSFKILWHAVGEYVGPLPDLEMAASDINPDYLDKARTGLYPLSSLKEVPEQWRDLYFQRTGEQLYDEGACLS